MKLKHRKPCSECPWVQTSARGYLGGHPPEMYADAVANNEIPACHNHDFGPDDPKSVFCVGSLHTAANACILPHKTEGAVEAREEVGKNKDCFAHPGLFYEYHARKPYVPFVIRMMDKA